MLASRVRYRGMVDDERACSHMAGRCGCGSRSSTVWVYFGLPLAEIEWEPTESRCQRSLSFDEAKEMKAGARCAADGRLVTQGRGAGSSSVRGLSLAQCRSQTYQSAEAGDDATQLRNRGSW